MAELRIEEYQVGAIGTNCYFLINDDTKEMIVVDPGGSVESLEKRIQAGGLKPVAILLTHGHYDHASGAAALKQAFGIKIYAHEAEKETLEQPQLNLSTMFTGRESYAADCYLKEGQDLTLAGFPIQVFHTPGHTAGGACYYFADEKVLISGDTLFCTSVGRSDFPGGSASQLVRSIKEKLMPLPDDVAVLPGHEGRSYIGYERDHNPFL